MIPLPSDEDLQRNAEAFYNNRFSGEPLLGYIRLFVAEKQRAEAAEREVARQNGILLAIAKEIGERLPLNVQHRSAVDALRWSAEHLQAAELLIGREQTLRILAEKRLETADRERDELQKQNRLHRDKANGDYWAWQGDGGDHLESLVCPVLIPASEIIKFQKLIAELESQLPEGMKHCTIQFKECEAGHGWLTATNWVQHGCPTCKQRELEAEVAKWKKDAAYLLNKCKALPPSISRDFNDEERMERITKELA